MRRDDCLDMLTPCFMSVRVISRIVLEPRLTITIHEIYTKLTRMRPSAKTAGGTRELESIDTKDLCDGFHANDAFSTFRSSM